MAWMLGAEYLRQMRELAGTLAASAEWMRVDGDEASRARVNRG